MEQPNNPTEVDYDPYNFASPLSTQINEVINDNIPLYTLFIAEQIRIILTIINKKYHIWDTASLKRVAGNIAMIISSINKNILLTFEMLTQAILVPLLNELPTKSCTSRNIIQILIHKMIKSMMKIRNKEEEKDENEEKDEDEEKDENEEKEDDDDDKDEDKEEQKE